MLLRISVPWEPEEARLRAVFALVLAATNDTAVISAGLLHDGEGKQEMR